MTASIYQELCQTMSQRGGRYPARDIPEFYELARVLFSPDEAAVANAQPRGFHPASAVAETMDRPESEVAAILEQMADKGLCTAGNVGGTWFYGAPPFVPGIFEFQFMRGTSTDRDRELARLIHGYKSAFDKDFGPPFRKFPGERVISVDRKVQAGNRIHTFDQVASYIDSYDPIAVSTCFCRHEAELLNPEDSCGKPNEVCMMFGMSAQYLIDRRLGRKVDKAEAAEILNMAEEAGLVHCSLNSQEIDFLCNCCSCHCMILGTALAQPKPALLLHSRFQPVFDADLCTACGTCVDRCPGDALSLEDSGPPAIDMDRCFGCGVCATGCPSDAVELIERSGAEAPPENRKALKDAISAAS